MLYRRITLIILFSLFAQLSYAESDAETEKLYISITEKKDSVENVVKRRFQRLLLQKIIQLGLFEFQIFDPDKLNQISIDGVLLKVELKKTTVQGEIEMNCSVERFSNGKKTEAVNRVFILKDAQLYNEGLTKIIDLLKNGK